MHQRPLGTYQWGAGGEGQRHGVRYVSGCLCLQTPRQMRLPLRATSEDAAVIDVYNAIRVLFYNVFSGSNNTYNAY